MSALSRLLAHAAGRPADTTRRGRSAAQESSRAVGTRLAGELIEAARGRDYGEGVLDGMRIALELLLGRPSSGAQPYEGPVPDELRAWAERALDRAS